MLLLAPLWDMIMVAVELLPLRAQGLVPFLNAMGIISNCTSEKTANMLTFGGSARIEVGEIARVGAGGLERRSMQMSENVVIKCARDRPTIISTT